MCAASNNEEGLAARSGHKCHNNITYCFSKIYVAHRHDIFAD